MIFYSSKKRADFLHYLCGSEYVKVVNKHSKKSSNA